MVMPADDGLVINEGEIENKARFYACDFVTFPWFDHSRDDNNLASQKFGLTNTREREDFPTNYSCVPPSPSLGLS